MNETKLTEIIKKPPDNFFSLRLAVGDVFPELDEKIIYKLLQAGMAFQKAIMMNTLQKRLDDVAFFMNQE